LIEVRGKPAADGPRYKALGNSMAVNVMRWIGTRIDFVDGLEAVSETLSRNA
jgi:DNA (cytosine-5)-methyltransferase 1